jgi:hypothetical protein
MRRAGPAGKYTAFQFQRTPATVPHTLTQLPRPLLSSISTLTSVSGRSGRMSTAAPPVWADALMDHHDAVALPLAQPFSQKLRARLEARWVSESK